MKSVPSTLLREQLTVKGMFEAHTPVGGTICWIAAFYYRWNTDNPNQQIEMGRRTETIMDLMRAGF